MQRTPKMHPAKTLRVCEKQERRKNYRVDKITTQQYGLEDIGYRYAAIPYENVPGRCLQQQELHFMSIKKEENSTQRGRQRGDEGSEKYCCELFAGIWWVQYLVMACLLYIRQIKYWRK